MRGFILTVLFGMAAAAPAFAAARVDVPEPASMAVLAVGAGALLIARARRK